MSDTETPGQFDLVVDLVGNEINKVLSIYLNFGASMAGLTFETGDDMNSDGVEADEDGVSAGGYSGFFDLRVPDPPPGNLDFEPYHNSIVITGLGMESSSVSLFDALDTGNLLYAAVHIGNIDDDHTPGSPGESSVWVGALTGPDITSTPEPGLLVLLGTGLLGAAIAARRRNESR